MTALRILLAEVRACTLCAAQLPLGPRPIVQLQRSARLLIAGQAPGRKVHETGVPFNDASGERLRAWLGISREQFYDARRIALLPMGFCFPGSGPSGDLPPRPECAPAWRAALLAELPRLELTLAIGRHAQTYHLPLGGASLTAAVRAGLEQWPGAAPPSVLALPHPSPRNQRWLRQNPWFEQALLPPLRVRVAALLAG